MKFKKIYIEITNSCNFSCSFCFKSSRTAKFMTPEEFSVIVEKIRPFTNYIYLHVLGEPLLHPKLNELLTIANAAGLNVNITTNGALLARKKQLLLSSPIRQINISLHDAEENISPNQWEEYINTTLDFATDAASGTYICLRLWNTSNEASVGFNALCLEKIAGKFNLSIDKLNEKTPGNGLRLAEHIFLQRAPRFEWPDEKREGKQNHRNCYALRDHIAILSDGQIVPCCLDADAAMVLGNIFSDTLQEALASSRAKDIKKGFEQRKIVEPICKTCGFVID